MSKRRRGPVRLDEALKSYLEGAGLEEPLEAAAVIPEWAERVGAGIAAVTTPLRVNNGVLFVAVRSSAWLMELKLIEGEIIRRLNAGRKKGKIKKIRFVMGEGSG